MRHAPFHDFDRRDDALPHKWSATISCCSDCRAELGNPHWGEAEYARSHLPGAQFLHLDRDLSSPITPTAAASAAGSARFARGSASSAPERTADRRLRPGQRRYARGCGGSRAGSVIAASRCSMAASRRGARGLPLETTRAPQPRSSRQSSTPALGGQRHGR
jgi:hypothetical protein